MVASYKFVQKFLGAPQKILGKINSGDKGSNIEDLDVFTKN